MKKIVLLGTTLLILSCNQTGQKEITSGPATSFNEDAEKAAIMKTIEFDPDAFKEYQRWIETDRRTA